MARGGECSCTIRGRAGIFGESAIGRMNLKPKNNMKIQTVRLYFTKFFYRGNLKGIRVIESIPFVSCERAAEWLKGIAKNRKRLDYEIVDKSFQNYAR